MKNIIYSILILSLIVGMSWFLFEKKSLKNNNQPSESSQDASPKINANNDGATDLQEQSPESAPIISTKNFQFPLDRASKRVTKKPFGIFITPQNSPVQPEKFSGYHTGVDFEVFPEELETDVLVKAVCAGKILMKRLATGYGGVAVQSCDLDKQSITVVYGHLKLNSIKVALGENIAVGETLGVLGQAYSPETSGERKHLHLSFHKGAAVNILGYVPSKSALANWLDPMLFLK